MSGYILCQNDRARQPFFIESISTNIYSLEELCYFLYHNLYLIDPTVINEELCDWLEEEIHVPSAAAKLRPHLNKFADVEDVLYPLFKEINYLSYEELKELSRRLQLMNQESAMMKKKKKGDMLSENGMYVNAIRAYQDLLKEAERDLEGEAAEEGEEHRMIREMGYHNLGCVFARLFQMDKAAELFLNAYEVAGNPEELEEYLLAYKSVKTPVEYESRLAELSVSETVRKKVQERLDAFARLPEQQVYTQHVEKLLSDLTADYHRSTGA